ncbi:hypothetical protein LEP1GSC172_4052 [Leptospira noguchii]|uniref:Uncharacterized protein n=1 Tax=Leptospira noguchii TaxID=28182 RepID=M6W043_9LEPT|nr:hypothetical protein LEP1GSC172_4052 [Leptospira noguchii]
MPKSEYRFSEIKTFLQWLSVSSEKVMNYKKIGILISFKFQKLPSDSFPLKSLI